MLNTSIVNINSALKYQAAIAIMQGDRQSIAALTEQSPFKVIQPTQGLYIKPAGNLENHMKLSIASIVNVPANYTGELFDPEPTQIEPGSWYFDQADKTLNYRVRNNEFFQSDLPGDIARIKLKVVIDYNDNNGNERYDADGDEFKSISLQVVGNYSWGSEGDGI